MTPADRRALVARLAELRVLLATVRSHLTLADWEDPVLRAHVEAQLAHIITTTAELVALLELGEGVHRHPDAQGL